MKSKIVISVLLTVFILTVGVGSMIAYFASITGPVKNTFTVGEVKISLTETTGGNYQLIPGATVAKDPVVTVERGSEECYVYVKLERHGNLDSYVSYELAEGWHNLGGIDGVYYRLVDRTVVNMSYHVLKDDCLRVNSDLTKETMATIAPDDCRLTVTAYAIQTSGMESPSDGWYNLLSELEE